MAIHGNHDPAALDTALAAARTLWSAAESISSDREGRNTASNTATAVWLGPHKDTFDGLYSDENQKSIATEAALRAEANEWASFWQICTNLRIERLHREAVSSWYRNHYYDSEGNSYPPGPYPMRIPDLGLPSAPSFTPAGALI